MKATATTLPSITYPVDKNVLSSELTVDKLIRTYKGLEIYLVTAGDSPRVMTEIGRIREVEFRRAGGGTGKPKDIDIFDQGPVPYRQLVVWDPVAQEIVSMYRYLLCRDAIQSDGSLDLATAQLFDFSQQFRKQYLPKTIELGRSVVNRSAQRRRLGLFAVWCGLGALVQEYPDMDYFFGKVTIVSPHSQAAQALLLQFMQRYEITQGVLVVPKPHCRVYAPASSNLLWADATSQAALSILKDRLKQTGQSLPSLLNSYLKTSAQLHYFGSVCNLEFGNVIEAAILIPINSIKAKPRQRFIDSYVRINSQRFRMLDRQNSENSLARDIADLKDFIYAAMTKKSKPCSALNTMAHKPLTSDSVGLRSQFT
ncbi:GNAT family N-acetyltransferase [Leptolyngbya cf. ectocarpi LEGE 11479]|uniref:GNAT family N-acetyltransferase n=1 Tax=Leptolyngbya cf. ectocarpi LEGE 11479 TaxID=1828722 RepID=A0A928WYV4_LEPEC|nr:GNAT family N-acetyltransferase [Leptolyngbya ectocarpi]MBE9065985.1 GNAT family N-acetyltransferase [Leptolyngbya cf. ectocarpi LEGE 11479]